MGQPSCIYNLPLAKSFPYVCNSKDLSNFGNLSTNDKYNLFLSFAKAWWRGSSHFWNIIFLDKPDEGTHHFFGSHHLEVTKFATFIASFILHVNYFDSNIGQFGSLIATCGERYTFHLFFELVKWPKLIAHFALRHILAYNILLWRLFDFILRPSTSILLENLLIFVTSFRSFGNLNNS